MAAVIRKNLRSLSDNDQRPLHPQRIDEVADFEYDIITWNPPYLLPGNSIVRRQQEDRIFARERGFANLRGN